MACIDWASSAASVAMALPSIDMDDFYSAGLDEIGVGFRLHACARHCARGACACPPPARSPDRRRAPGGGFARAIRGGETWREPPSSRDAALDPAYEAVTRAKPHAVFGTEPLARAPTAAAADEQPRAALNPTLDAVRARSPSATFASALPPSSARVPRASTSPGPGAYRTAEGDAARLPRARAARIAPPPVGAGGRAARRLTPPRLGRPRRSPSPPAPRDAVRKASRAPTIGPARSARPAARGAAAPPPSAAEPCEPAQLDTLRRHTPAHAFSSTSRWPDAHHASDDEREREGASASGSGTASSASDSEGSDAESPRPPLPTYALVERRPASARFGSAPRFAPPRASLASASGLSIASSLCSAASGEWAARAGGKARGGGDPHDASARNAPLDGAVRKSARGAVFGTEARAIARRADALAADAAADAALRSPSALTDVSDASTCRLERGRGEAGRAARAEADALLSTRERAPRALIMPERRLGARAAARRAQRELEDASRAPGAYGDAAETAAAVVGKASAAACFAPHAPPAPPAWAVPRAPSPGPASYSPDDAATRAEPRATRWVAPAQGPAAAAAAATEPARRPPPSPPRPFLAPSAHPLDLDRATRARVLGAALERAAPPRAPLDATAAADAPLYAPRFSLVERSAATGGALAPRGPPSAARAHVPTAAEARLAEKYGLGRLDGARVLFELLAVAAPADALRPRADRGVARWAASAGVAVGPRHPPARRLGHYELGIDWLMPTLTLVRPTPAAAAFGRAAARPPLAAGPPTPGPGAYGLQRSELGFVSKLLLTEGTTLGDGGLQRSELGFVSKLLLTEGTTLGDGGRPASALGALLYALPGRRALGAPFGALRARRFGGTLDDGAAALATAAAAAPAGAAGAAARAAAARVARGRAALAAGAVLLLRVAEAAAAIRTAVPGFRLVREGGLLSERARDALERRARAAALAARFAPALPPADPTPRPRVLGAVALAGMLARLPLRPAGWLTAELDYSPDRSAVEPAARAHAFRRAADAARAASGAAAGETAAALEALAAGLLALAPEHADALVYRRRAAARFGDAPPRFVEARFVELTDAADDGGGDGAAPGPASYAPRDELLRARAPAAFFSRERAERDAPDGALAALAAGGDLVSVDIRLTLVQRAPQGGALPREAARGTAALEGAEGALLRLGAPDRPRAALHGAVAMAAQSERGRDGGGGGGDGADAAYEPRDALLRPRSHAPVDMARATGRHVGAADPTASLAPPLDVRHAAVEAALRGGLISTAPTERVGPADAASAHAPLGAEGALLQLDVQRSLVERALRSAQAFDKQLARDLGPAEADARPLLGADADAPLRARAPAPVDMARAAAGGAEATVVHVRAPLDVRFGAVEPAPRAADFARARGRADGADGDGDGGCGGGGALLLGLGPAERPRAAAHGAVAMATQLPRDGAALGAPTDGADVAYAVDEALVRPRTRAPVDMARDGGRPADEAQADGGLEPWYEPRHRLVERAVAGSDYARGLDGGREQRRRRRQAVAESAAAAERGAGGPAPLAPAPALDAAPGALAEGAAGAPPLQQAQPAQQADRASVLERRARRRAAPEAARPPDEPRADERGSAEASTGYAIPQAFGG